YDTSCIQVVRRQKKLLKIKKRYSTLPICQNRKQKKAFGSTNSAFFIRLKNLRRETQQLWCHYRSNHHCLTGQDIFSGIELRYKRLFSNRWTPDEST
ncbi:MAG: hypothetical protein ACP5FP_11375, partial [Desulfuromonadaceae bacterium]